MVARRFALGLSLCLFATPALADPVVDSVLALCAPHHGESRAVLAAAEAQGWTKAPSCAPDAEKPLEARLCDQWRYKEIGGALLLLNVEEEEAAWAGGRHRIRRCSVSDDETTRDALAAATETTLGTAPQPPQGPITVWIWQEGPSGRAFLPPTTEEMLVAAGENGPIYALQLDPADPTTLTYSELVKLKP